MVFFSRFGNEESARTDGEDDMAAGPTMSTNPRLFRQSDIAKPRSTKQEVSSPERSLLHGSSGLYGVGGDSAASAGSPTRRDARIDFPEPSTRTTPPRNIFDDL